MNLTITHLESRPPEILQPKEIKVTFRHNYTFQVIAQAQTKVNWNYSLITPNEEYIKMVDVYSGKFSVQVGAPELSVMLFAIDEHDRATSLQLPIQMCYCLNGGTCDGSTLGPSEVHGA